MNEREFEDLLKHDLGGLDAPEGFADRVMWRVAAREGEREGFRRQPARHRLQAWRMAIAASLLVCFGLGGYQVQQRREAVEARAQFALAMQVTGRSLKAVDRGLGRMDHRLNEGNGETR